MIKLDSTKILALDRLKVPPTYAVCVSLRLEWSPAGRKTLSADFQYGDVVDGMFLADPTHGTVTLDMPRSNGPENTAPFNLHDILLENTFAKDVAPHPSEPTRTVASVGKIAGDVRRADVEAIAAAFHPSLLGSVVPD